MVTAQRTLTINAAFLQEIKEDNRELRQLLDDCAALLSRPHQAGVELRRVSQLFGKLRDQLAMHFSLEEAYGYFDDAIDVAPRLSRQAEVAEIAASAVVRRAMRPCRGGRAVALSRAPAAGIGRSGERLRAISSRVAGARSAGRRDDRAGFQRRNRRRRLTGARLEAVSKPPGTVPISGSLWRYMGTVPRLFAVLKLRLALFRGGAGEAEEADVVALRAAARELFDVAHQLPAQAFPRPAAPRANSFSTPFVP